ncbi:MAG: hypothetical protein ANABAC_0573 [Anaerolineae bacterium]|nr:MAG: hypothetical protein ANABAC_0573 [Anaerolineae bacterium]
MVVYWELLTQMRTTDSDSMLKSFAKQRGIFAAVARAWLKKLSCLCLFAP